MKKKKIHLDKQVVVKLSDSELSDLKGGGYGRSSRAAFGDCKYSNKHPHIDQHGQQSSCEKV